MRTEAELEEAVSLVREANGPILVTLKVSGFIGELFPRNRDGVLQKAQFRKALLGKA